MATKKTTSKSRKTNDSTLWIVVAVVLAFLLIWSLASNITRVDVGTVQNDLANLQAQLTAQAAVTEAPATEASAAIKAPAETEEAPAATEEAVADAPAQPATPQASVQVSHDQHLLNLDPTYRSQGWEAWLRAAGIQFDSSKVESRQPVEAVIKDHVTVTSLVIRATGMKVNWPACITTDRPNEVSTSSETRQHQPDLTNPSVMYTNATLNGQGTVYADCSDWGQLDPTK